MSRLIHLLGLHSPERERRWKAFELKIKCLILIAEDRRNHK